MGEPVSSQATAHYEEIVRFFDRFADEEDRWLVRSGGYHELVARIYRALIPPGQRVLEIGAGRGDLLADLQPSRGVGIDVSPRMVAVARERHPGLDFVLAAGEDFSLDETFDYIVLSDLVAYVHDLQALLGNVAAHSHPGTRVLLNTYSNAWRPALGLLSRARIRPDRPVRNWVAPRDLGNLLELAGFEVVAERKEILLPFAGEPVSALANGALARLPLLRELTLTYWAIARPQAVAPAPYGVSVIVPCRNEAGSISAIVERVPELGTGTEIVFVEGGSEDDTRARIEEAIAARPDRRVRLLVQTGRGKANAVREGFEAAREEILMVLDGDLTVAPEELGKFYEALASGRGELVVGTRLVYGMEPDAMRFLNLLGNKGFAWLLSFVLGQYVKDTLCGTKALLGTNYRRIRALRPEFGEDDPYGDFELLLGASLLGLKIVNIPVRYSARVYGASNIHRFSDGRRLLRLAGGGYRRIWMRPVQR